MERYYFFDTYFHESKITVKNKILKSLHEKYIVFYLSLFDITCLQKLQLQVGPTHDLIRFLNILRLSALLKELGK